MSSSTCPSLVWDFQRFSGDLSCKDTAAFSFKRKKSCDLEPVGKEKHDPNAVTTRAVAASVGTGCGGFQG